MKLLPIITLKTFNIHFKLSVNECTKRQEMENVYDFLSMGNAHKKLV